MTTKEKEDYLIKITRRVCEWLGHDGDDTTDEEISALVMNELMDF